jgi:ACS family glucarate transporter-like MFS transporter
MHSHAPGAADLRNAQLLIVALLFGFSMASYFDRTIMAIAGPQLMLDFGVSPTAMGSVYSAFILGYALTMIPGGLLTDRLGPRRALTLMGMGSAIFTGLTIVGGRPDLGVLIGVVPALFAIRFGLGVVTAPLYPAAARIGAHWIPVVRHGQVQGLIIAGSSFGAAISPLLFAWIAARFGGRAPFLVAALATAALAAFWYLYARDYPSGADHFEVPGRARPAQPWGALFRDRNLLLITYAYSALGYFQYIFFYWMYYYFGQVLHLGEDRSARYTTILFLTEGSIMPLGGLVSDRLTRRYGPHVGRRMVPIAGLSLGAALLYFGTVSAGVTAVACFSLAFGFAASCEGPFWATVTEIAGERVGGASSILNTGAQVGGFFAPILTPLIASRIGWSWGLYGGALVALSGVIAVYFVNLRPLAKDESSVDRKFCDIR